MKKIYSLIMVSAIAMTSKAQIAFFENFTGYTTGDLGTQGGWTTTMGTPDVQVANTSQLIYPGYTSGSEYVTVESSNGRSPRRTFTGVSTITTKSFYISFVVRSSYAQLSDNSPDYSISLFNTADGDRPLRFYIAEEPTDNGEIRFGIATGLTSNSVDWTSTTSSFVHGTTYLILIRYDINAGTGNDAAWLWVNPDLSSEPATSFANALVQNQTEADYLNVINALGLFQSNNNDSPDAAYDGFRVAYGATSGEAWNFLSPAGAPLPVRLTSFNASEEALNTKLIWNTAEENGISSYIIEKSTDGRTFTAIGTVKAANLRTYSFTDIKPSENSFYRLKMVEADGTYKLSYIISVKSKLTTNISLSPNPVRNMLMIQHPKVSTTGHIQIISAKGQLLKDIRLSANAVISNIDMSSFTSGLYHIVYKSGSDMFTRTVIKQ